MDNAVKALIIAGAVLIAILLISVGIMVFNASSDPINQATNSSEQQAVRMFNEAFTGYLGTDISAQAAKSLISQIKSSNAKNPDHLVNATKGQDGNVTDNVTPKISSIDNKKRYKAEEDYDTDGYINKITITAN